MITTRKIGDAVVTNIIETTAPSHDPYALFPDMTPAEIDAALEAARSTLTPNHWFPSVNRLVSTIQTWVVQYAGNIVVIDTSVGNAKNRPPPRMHMLNTSFLLWLEAIGAAPKDVTHVVNTHLHTDHVGWNTRPVDGRNVPTFPNARYFMPRIDYDYFAALAEKSPGNTHAIAFEDSVRPIVDAGMADLVEAPGELAEGLRLELAHGHTPGQMNVHLDAGGERGVFCADVFHSPLQVAVPDLNTKNCIVPDLARSTRKALLAAVADTGTLVMPCHFGAPYCGTIRKVPGGTYELAAPKPAA